MTRVTRDRVALRRTRLLVAVLLAGVALAAFAPVSTHSFLGYDDGGYVANNARVQAGLTLANVRWALTTFEMANWHPLVWLSHMLDCTLFGLDAGRHHRTSAWLHAGNAVLLFLVLESMTGALGRSALVAALFALHPLHVESVAWVAERKDVLSTLFWMLTLLAYGRWVRTPRPGRYALVLLAFGLGLMAKPMLVTLPFVLLLLDVWPLGRLAAGVRPARLVWEKLPLFALAAAASALTIAAQRASGAIRSTTDVPLTDRIANALLTYVAYLGKTVWPFDLACFYPYRRSFVSWQVAAAAALLVVLSLAALQQARRRPALLVGWLWFLGTLVPVIGLVQVGPQAMADRYTYVPLIGVFLALVWGVGDLLAPASDGASSAALARHRSEASARSTAPRRGRSILAALLAGGALLGCFLLTREQVGYWRDGPTLFEHALAVNGDNHVLHFNLSVELMRLDRVDEAMAQYREAIRTTPSRMGEPASLASVLVDQGWPAEAAAQQAGAFTLVLGTALWQRGRVDEAVEQYTETIRLVPENADAHNNLGLALAAQGRNADALAHFGEALRLRAGYADASYNRANVLAAQGKLDDAIADYRETLRLQPDFREARNNLGLALASAGRVDDAIGEYAEAVRRHPDYVDPYVNWASALLGQRRFDEAARLYREALRRAPAHPDAHYGLANALAQQGRLTEAISEYDQALQARPAFAEAHNNLGLVLAAEGKSADAIAHYSEALRTNSAFAAAYVNRAAAHRLTGDAAAAEADLARARELDPRVP